DHPRKPQSRQWLEDCFYNRITRKVRKDSTITIDKVCYDVPMQFISAKVDIRYLPDDMDSAFILFENQKFPIRQTNRNENCHTKRSNPAIDYSKIGGNA
ncbi:MAG: Mu transposase C-terminal domain-containing protein, partial [Acetivibrio ethanolgignens]